MALKTWTGGAGTTTWATAGNWSPSGAPGTGDDALFSSFGSTVNITTGTNVCKSLTVTGSFVTLSGTSALSIFGNITVNSTTNVSATGTWTIASTSDIISAGVTFNCNLILNASFGTYRLVKADSSANGNLTLASARTLTLTTGTLNLNGYNLSTGLFSSSSSSTRSITFSSDNSNSINLTGVGTVFSQTTSAGWSYTGFSNFTVSNATGTAKTVTTTGMSSYPANFYFTNAGTVTLTSGNWFLILDATAMTGTLSKASASTMIIGASLVFTSGTSAIGGSGATTFSIVSGLGGSLATGTVNLGGRNWGPMTFSSGAWITTGVVGASNATNTVTCSGGSLYIDYDFFCNNFIVSVGTVTLNAILTCTETSTSTTAFLMSSGIFTMLEYGGVVCGVATVGAGRIALEYYGFSFDCLRMNFTGSATWDGLDIYNYLDLSSTFNFYGSHIKQRSVASNWNSASFFQNRYQASSTQIVVNFTTFDASSSTLRNISDSSGMFAFCFDAHMTLTQRIGVTAGSVLGGLDLSGMDPSTFEGTSSFTINGSYIDDDPVYRGTGGILTFTGGTSLKPHTFAPNNRTAWPFSMVFGSNGYFELGALSFVTSIRTDSFFHLRGCTMVSYGTQQFFVDIIIGSVDLNNSGTNTFICDNPATNLTNFNVLATNGTVINARGAGLTITGNPKFYLLADNGFGRTVNLPTLSNYSYSSTGGMAASFFRDSNEDTVTIADNSFVYRFTAGSTGTTNFTNLYVQNGITTNTGAVNGTSLFILGVFNSSSSTIHSVSSINNVYIGDAAINSTDTAVNFAGGTASSIGTLTVNSGVVAIRMAADNNNSILLPNLVINSINAASATTVSIPQQYSDIDLYIRNLTIATTGTINFSNNTVLISDPNNVDLYRTWELGGRTIPKVIVNNNSRVNFTDSNVLDTTYIKEVSAGYVDIVAPASVSFNVISISVAGGTANHSYNPSTRVLTFSNYGGGSTRNNQSVTISYQITVAAGTRVDYSINWAISSEANFDKGSVTMFIPAAQEGSPEEALFQRPVNAVSGSTSGTATGTLIGGYQWAINMNYQKDGSATSGTDTFNGTITFTTVQVSPLSSFLYFPAGRTFTFDKFFHDPTAFPLFLESSQSGSRANLAIPARNLGTLVQGTNPGGTNTVSIRDVAVTSGEYIWYTGKFFQDRGNNSGWIFAESPTQLSTQFFL